MVGLVANAARVVEVAGDRVTARGVAKTMSELTGTPFKLQFAGTTGTLSLRAKAVRCFSKSKDAAFSAWQGMQYFVSMFSGQAQLRHVDNDRCGDHDWTSVRDHGGYVPIRRGSGGQPAHRKPFDIYSIYNYGGFTAG